MSNQIDKPPLSPEQELVIQAAAEVAHAGEEEQMQHRELVEKIVAEGAGDIATREALLAMFDNYIETALGRQKTVAEAPKANKEVPIAVDLAQIGWLKNLPKKGADRTMLFMGEQVTTPALNYELADLISFDRVTRDCYEKVVEQGGASKLWAKLAAETIPQLWDDVKNGRGRQRPISRGNRPISETKAQRSLDTKYPGYKVDLQGTNNRAIVLIVGQNEEQKPRFAVVAIYDHEDQDRVIEHLFAKTKGVSK